MTELEQLLHDADVHWMGTDIGLNPALADSVANRLNALGPAQISDMIDALLQESDFAAAHVILTRISGVEYEGAPTWNGLAVEITPDGAAHIDPAQRFRLARRWRRWFASQPRPSRLPPPD
jgi:hypothetical protein